MRRIHEGRLARAALGCALLAVVAAGCGSDSDAADEGEASVSAPADELRIAAIFGGSITASGWDREGAEAVNAMADSIGAEVSMVASVDYGVAAETLNRLANEGYDPVIAHSSGFEAAVLEVAAAYPDTQFILFSDISIETPPSNVAAWKVNWNELGYLMGVAMCTISETGTIGHVSSAPIPAFTRMAGGIEQATETEGNCAGREDPLKITFTGSFTDAALAKSAALSILGQGATVMSDAADAAGKAVVQASVDASVPYVGSMVDVEPLGPEVVSTSVVIDFDTAYAQMGELIASDSLEEGGIYQVDVASGGLTFLEPVKNVENVDEVTEVLRAAFAGIQDGTLKVDPTRTRES